MIYVVTQQVYEPYSDGIDTATPQDILNYFSDKPEIGVDSETEGFDPYTKAMLLLQLGDERVQFVIDVSTIDVKLFKELLETKTVIMHNAKFDLKFLYHYGIYPYKNVFCTYLCERIISTGLDFHRKSLAACLDRHLKVTMSKEVRGLIHKLGIFNPRVIKYSADDVKYLIPLKKAQLEHVKEFNLDIAVSLDNQFVSVLAYIEYCGVYLDKEGWLKKCDEDLEVLRQRENALNTFVIENFKNSKYVEAPNLFTAVYLCKINWSSSQQVIPLFEELGVDVTCYEKGKVTKSLEAGNLVTQVNVHPIVSIYLEFQKAKKLVTTYGRDFLRHINHKTGRIHTNYTQIKNTGRLSSGKDKDEGKAKDGDVNMQNIPAGRERNYFKAEPLNCCVIADYSGQETRVLADFAKDPEFTKYVSDPDKDLHSLMASLIYPELKVLSHDEIKKIHKGKRQFAKAATFAIPYGGDGSTISGNLGLPKAEGDRVYEEFMDEFPGLKDHFERSKKQVLKDGYVLINNTTNRKSFIPNFEQFKAQQVKMNNLFWDSYRVEKEINSELYQQEFKPFVSKYFRKKGDIERAGLNYKIQGSSADISKLAGIYFYEWILKEGLWGSVKICVPLHDEYFTEVPQELGKISQTKLEESMIRAAKVFCKVIPFTVESTISDHWTH